jgi:cell division septation protein DedD
MADDVLLPAESLLVPTPARAKGRFALQLGQFERADAADWLARRARELSLHCAVLAVVDRAGRLWSVVATGVYASPEAARAARPTVAQQLGLLEPPAVIFLPLSKAKS